LQIADNLPQVAAQMDEVAVLRNLSTKEGDHQRAAFLAHTGRVPQGPIRYPTFGSVTAKEIGGPRDMPHFVSVGSANFATGNLGSGFLGPAYSPLIVPNPQAGNGGVANLQAPLPDSAFDQRLGLLQVLQDQFVAERPDPAVHSHHSAYDRALNMMRGRAQRVFDLNREPAYLRDQYGRNPFGQGCLLARRLVETGVPFVEVNMDGWDTHGDNFNQCRNLCGTLDAGWAALLRDLKQRGMLDSTLVVWMGEFGRTPNINGNTGRDHYPRAWSAALAGAGIRGGQAVGATSDGGESVAGPSIGIPNVLATVCHALRMDPSQQNMSNVGRPIRLVDPDTAAIEEVV
jgi:hypothetical protein